MPDPRTVELIGVPFSSRGRGDGIARGSEALRSEGLVGSLREVTRVQDAGDLPLGAWEPGRGPSGLLNEAGLIELLEACREAVTRARKSGRWPLLVGGDCPALLGALAALRDAGAEPGLLMLDGHEDAWPPRSSPTGEASDSELGMALGLLEGMPRVLRSLLPLLRPERTALVGPRDHVELKAEGVPSLKGRLAVFAPEDVRERGPDTVGREALAALGAEAGPWWLHIDFDVLTTEAFPAADYPQGGGLAWSELAELAGPALAEPGCAGATMVIYNADLDPDRTVARRTIRFMAEVLAPGARR